MAKFIKKKQKMIKIKTKPTASYIAAKNSKIENFKKKFKLNKNDFYRQKNCKISKKKPKKNCICFVEILSPLRGEAD